MNFNWTPGQQQMNRWLCRRPHEINSYCTHTTERVLHNHGLKGRSSDSKTLYKKCRFKFAGFCWNVLFFDKTNLNCLAINISVNMLRKMCEAFNLNNTIPNVKHWGGSIMLCGCFPGDGAVITIILIPCSAIIKYRKEDYSQILKVQLKVSGRKLKHGSSTWMRKKP